MSPALDVPMRHLTQLTLGITKLCTNKRSTLGIDLQWDRRSCVSGVTSNHVHGVPARRNRDTIIDSCGSIKNIAKDRGDSQRNSIAPARHTASLYIRREVYTRECWRGEGVGRKKFEW